MTTQQSFSHIAIVMAMQAEAQPLIEKLALEPQATDYAKPLPVKVYSGEVQSRQVSIIINGKDQRFDVDKIATQPAALSAFVTLKYLQPDVVISAGTAGGFEQRGAQIGDVYLSKDTIKYHDRRIALPGGFTPYGIGSYPVLDVSQIAQQLGFKMGNVSSSNSLDMPDIDREMMHAQQADVKEMEAAAIAYVAELFQVPMFAIKAITDLVDIPHATEEQFLANLKLAAEKLQQAVVDVLKVL